MSRFDDARRLDLRDEARRLGIDLAKGGRAFFRPGGRGPAGKSPSGSIYVDEAGVWRWYDHAAGTGGDVVDLLMEYGGCQTKDEALDRLLGDERPALPPVEYKPAEVREDVPHPIRAAACRAFYEALPPLGDAARAWLLETRAISGDTVTRFGLRQSDETSAPLAMGAAIEAVGVEVVVALGLGKPSKHGDGLWCPLGWGCWIAIPYRNGDEVGHLQFRRFHRDESKPAKGPKYQHIRGEVPYPFNLKATAAGPTMLVEGAFDAMVLAQNNVGAVGLPGVSWLRQGKRALALVKRAQTLCVALDADDAGTEAREPTEALLWHAGADCVDRVLWPPDFRGDWCDFYREGRIQYGMEQAPRPAMTIEPSRGPDQTGCAPLLGWGDVFARGTDALLAEATGQSDRPGLRTGIDGLDRWFRLTAGSYTVIAARPAAGKSHLLLSMAQKMAAVQGHRVGLLSLEMSEYQCSERIAKAGLGVGRDLPSDTDRLVRGVEAAMKRNAELRVSLSCPDDRREASVLRELDRFAAQGCDVVMLDYVQYIECKGGGIEEKTARASALCKAWAKRTKIPIVVAAMLRRSSGDAREATRRPTMSQVRGSGQIEQDADVLLLMHYPWKHDAENGSEVSRDLYIDKNRNGLICTEPIPLAYPEPFGFFGDLKYRDQLRRAGVK